MKKIMTLLAVLAFAQVANAASGGASNELFMHKKCYAAGGTGAGQSQADPAAISASDVLVIPARTVVSAVELVVTTAVTGSSPDLLVGDDDDADGFVASANATEGTPGVYLGAGAYAASGAMKYYSATGKEVKFSLTGTASAGAFCVVVRGYRI